MRYIYIIQNKINNKIYVGQSKVPNNRWIRHKYDALTRKKLHPLYQSIRKYGVENFSFQIIEEWSIDEIDTAEKFWIQFFRSWDRCSGYNLDLGGCNGKIVSNETRAKQSVSSKQRYNAETKIRLRKARQTPQSREKTSKSTTGSKNPRANINEQTVLLIRQLWETGNYKQTELSEKFSIPKTTINHIVNRYTWKHII